MFELKAVCSKCGQELKLVSNDLSEFDISSGSGITKLNYDPHVCRQNSHINLSAEEREKHTRCRTCNNMGDVCNTCIWFPFSTDNWRG